VNLISEHKKFKILAVNVDYDCDGWLFSYMIIHFTSEHSFIQNKHVITFWVKCLFLENCLHSLTSHSYFWIKILKSLQQAIWTV